MCRCSSCRIFILLHNAIDVHALFVIHDHNLWTPATASVSFWKHVTYHANAISISPTHTQASNHVDRSLQLIKSCGLKSGLVLTPSTSLDYCKYVMDKVDIILLMSVNPGFGGQSFIPSTLGVSTSYLLPLHFPYLSVSCSFLLISALHLWLHIAFSSCLSSSLFPRCSLLTFLIILHIFVSTH